MRNVILLALLFLSPTLLAAQDTADSLFRLYESGGRSQQSALAKQLIPLFAQEELYDWPVPKGYSDRKFSEMLVYLGMGLHNLNESDFTQAVKLGLAAERLVPKDSLLWLSSCYELLNVAYTRQGDYAKAIEYAQKDYELGERLNDDKLRSTALNTLAAIHCYTRHLDKALEYSNRAIAIERKGSNDKALAVRLGVKSEILLLMNRPEESLEAINEAIDIDTKADRIEKVGIRLSQKADILAHQQQWKECRATCLQALDIFNRNHNLIDKIITLKQLGGCEIQLRQYESAERHLKEGERLCLQTGFRPQLWRIRQRLSILYKETGQFEKAMGYLEQATALKDSLSEERQQQIISEYQTRFDLKEKEQELELQQSKTRNRSIFATAAALLAVLAAAFAIAGYKLANIRKKRNAELEEVNTIKNRFFSIVSHDLKNPVRAQTQLLDYLDEHYDEVDDETKKKQIAALKESGNRLSELLTSLLDWASIAIGRTSCTPIRVDLASVVRKNLQLAQPTAEAKGIRITSTIDEPCHVFTDLNCVDTILRNLLSNAVKFSRKDGTIEIETERRDNDWIRISVTDHGVGMNAKQRDSIFHLRKISTLGTNEETGTGLGLIVCKNLATMAHCDLNFTSEEGYGSTFTLTLPLTEEAFRQA